MKLDTLNFKKKRLSESISLYKDQSGLSWKDLAELLDVTYLKVKRWADGLAFPKSEEDLDKICNSLSLNKETLFKIPTVQDLVFHSLNDLVHEYEESSGDSVQRMRIFLLVTSVVYSRMLQLPNTSMVVKDFKSTIGNLELHIESLFFNSCPFGIVGGHDCIRYYDYAKFLDTGVPDLKPFNSSVLDSFVK